MRLVPSQTNTVKPTQPVGRSRQPGHQPKDWRTASISVKPTQLTARREKRNSMNRGMSRIGLSRVHHHSAHLGRVDETSFQSFPDVSPRRSRRISCEHYTVRAHFFSCAFLSACLSQLVVRVVQVHTATWSRTDPTHHAWLKDSRSTLFVSCPKTVTLHRAMSYVTPHLTTPSTCTPSLSSTLSSSHALHPFLSEPKPCADPRCTLSGALAEPPHPSQVLSPSSFLKTRLTEDKQFC